MIVVDSCGWLEYFAGAANKEFFRAALEDTESLIVPQIVVYEVCRRAIVLSGADAAKRVYGFLRLGHIVGLETDDMVQAASAAAQYKLSIADAIIWRTAQVHKAKLYTQDAGLQHLPDVVFKAKPLSKDAL